MAPEQVFLTDTRRTTLENYDGDNSTHRTHKSRTKARATGALDELLWVAECEEIDNAEVFTPRIVRKLLDAILSQQNITPYWQVWDASDEVAERYDEQYRYERRLTRQIRNVAERYDTLLNESERPPAYGNEDTGGLVHETDE